MISDEYLQIDSLLPDAANYNRHSPETIALLASSIVNVGFTAPFLVDAQTRTIAAGHRRRLALMKLRAEGHAEPDGVKPGWFVPCRVGEWSEIQRLKVLLGDNPDPARIDYDTERLTALLSELEGQGELEGSGYDEARLEQLIGELAGQSEGMGGGSGLLPDVDPDEVPEAAEVETRCQPGDLWALGEHRLLCGDSTRAEDVARLMGGERAAMLWSDPPYGLGGYLMAWVATLAALTTLTPSRATMPRRSNYEGSSRRGTQGRSISAASSAPTSTCWPHAGRLAP